jgi:hypothetical protein|tara:strand:+ start:1988 stop:2398 length:411 start_codon:yes stop_codon:yes gene_type:complete
MPFSNLNRTFSWTGSESIGNSFEAFPIPVTAVGDQKIRGQLSALYVYVTTIAGGAADIIGCATNDAAGDQPLFPDTTITIQTGKTTATSGGVTFAVDAIVADISQATMQLWLKTDAGTCVVTRIDATFLSDGRPGV